MLYFVAQAGSLAWSKALHDNPGLWPAGAVGLVAILGTPDGRRWRIALTTLLANVAAHALVSGLSGPGVVLGMCVRLLIDWAGAEAVIALLGPRPHLDRTGPLLRFAALITFVIVPLGAIAGGWLIAATGGPPATSAVPQWYFTELVMTLLLAPALWVSLEWFHHERRMTGAAFLERLVALVAVAGAIAAVTTHPHVARITLPIGLVAVPFLILIAYRYGVGMTAWASVITFATILAITASGVGSFAESGAPGFERFVAVELYVGAIGASTVLLAAVLSDLRRSSDRFQSFLDTAPEAILAVDLDRRIVGFSAAADAIFVKSAKQHLTIGGDPMAPTQGTPEVMARRTEGWKRALSGHSDVAVLTPDPDTRMEMRYEPMRGANGEVVGAVATATDLLQLEQEAQARVRAERLEAIGRLAGGVAHDVNNLMTIVLGQAYVLRPHIAGAPEAAGALDEIEETVERTQRLTTQLLAFSRAQVVAPRVVSLAAQVDAVTSLLQRVLEEHTEIEVQHLGESWNVALDVGQFEQIMLNLAANARDAMPQGGKVSITTGSATLTGDEAARLGLAPGDYATLAVRDTGVGIAPDVLRDIFEPFFTTKGEQGTGLGLATVQAVVRKLGGTVRATSTIGEGSAFSLWIPRSLEALDIVEPAAIEAPVVSVQARVVVCEDNDAIRRIVVRLLSGAGLQVHSAPTPASALEWLASDGRDTQLLVSDVVMPGMSGVELSRAARDIVPGLRVLLMTGYADDILHGLGDADRPDDVIPKPFHGADLVARARALLTPNPAKRALGVLATVMLSAALFGPPLLAQRLNAGMLQERAVPAPDTTVILRSGEKDLVAELRVPTGAGPHPLAIVIHGGCWVTKFADSRYMRPMSEALRQAGFATWTISYRRADEPGGGWPGTFEDVAAEAALVKRLAPRFHLDLTRVIASGHSAGAHLALWLAAQPKLPRSSGVRAKKDALRIDAVVAIDGPGDLAMANTGISTICGGNVLEQLLASTPAAEPERWRLASPSEFLPLGVPQAMVRGGLDWRLPTLGSEAGSMPVYATRARAAGDSTWVVMSDSTNHFTMLDPERPAYAVLLQAFRDALAAIQPRRSR